ncbi:MAG: YnbE family lipoprotein [Alphaproteobacteria bacterium]|nr:YnbE family lipoprotein [Alphaproteobacteria bacterium]
MPNKTPLLSLMLLGSGLLLSAACTPTVQLQAPDKPIEINLNVNIEQHVKVEIQQDARKVIAKNKDIF